VKERRSQKLQHVLEIGAVTLFALISLAVAIYTYRLS